MLVGPQQGLFRLVFRKPADCADMLASGEADIGIVPSIELPRQRLAILPGLGIASRGDVRSILLVSKVPLGEVKILAADINSRTSIALARILLSRQYQAEPRIASMPPDVNRMLEGADAALVIGDAALQFDPSSTLFATYDLGREWTSMTGLPMVFAVWAAKKEMVTSEISQVFKDSYEFGRQRLERIAEEQGPPRGLTVELAREYLTRHVVFEIGGEERAGLDLYLGYAQECGILDPVRYRWDPQPQET